MRFAFTWLLSFQSCRIFDHVYHGVHGGREAGDGRRAAECFRGVGRVGKRRWAVKIWRRPALGGEAFPVYFWRGGGWNGGGRGWRSFASRRRGWTLRLRLDQPGFWPYLLALLSTRGLEADWEGRDGWNGTDVWDGWISTTLSHDNHHYSLLFTLSPTPLRTFLFGSGMAVSVEADLIMTAAIKFRRGLVTLEGIHAMCTQVASRRWPYSASQALKPDT